MSRKEIFVEISTTLPKGYIIRQAERERESPMGFLLTYIRDKYGLPKTDGWNIAADLVKFFDLDNKETPTDNQPENRNVRVRIICDPEEVYEAGQEMDAEELIRDYKEMLDPAEPNDKDQLNWLDNTSIEANLAHIKAMWGINLEITEPK